MSALLRKIRLKISVFLGQASTRFNPSWKAYKLLATGIFILCFSLWRNYENYQRQEPKKISIDNLSITPVENLNVGDNVVEVSQKTVLLLTPKSYTQQLMFDLDPNSENIFSLSFALLFFVITVGVFFILRNTSTDFKFSSGALISLNRFYYLIYVVVIVKVLMIFKFNSYITDFVDTKVHLLKPSAINGLGIMWIYGLFATVLLTMINFFKQGLALQEEQDLTV